MGQSISLLSPASTYEDILLINASGQGLTNVPVQIQDGLGNATLMTISTGLINFDRGIAEFQLDGVALTASAATLNNISDVANANYVLVSANVQLPASSVLTSTAGISVTPGGGNITLAPSGELAGIQALGTTGIVVRTAPNTYTTRNLVVDGTINLTNASGIAGNPTLGVINDTTRQRVNIQNNGVFQSQKSQLNFIPGANMGITITDNGAQNRTDIVLSAATTNALVFKSPCYAATTANLNAIYNNGASGVGATLTNAGALATFGLDGTVPPVASRILVKNQATTANNGIYVLSNAGSGAVAWVLTRATDFDTSLNILPASFTNILNGTVNISTSWIETNMVNIVGTDPIAFAQFGFYGTVVSVSGTPGEIDVVNGTTNAVISIDPAYVGQTSITTLGTVDTGTWEGESVEVIYGGTGNDGSGFVAYSVICGGEFGTLPLQSVADVGTAGQFLTSNGPDELPTWENGNALSFVLFVNQVAHGLVEGNVIKCTGDNTYALAQANTSANAEVIGIVVQKVDNDNFVYQFGGIVSPASGATGGQVLFLDPATPGRLTLVKPTTGGQVVKPLAITIDATTIYWMNQIGQVL